jgi:glycosyltransferase involved in cell wall biosynthesis
MKSNKLKLSVVIPALNEEKAIEAVIKQIPVKILEGMGYETEIIIVDNNSTDRTAEIAREHGVTVIFQPIRGYGNAYKAGFNGASGDVIITGDADMTYPFDAIPELLAILHKEEIDFMNTDRLSKLNPEAMTYSHIFGNWLLSLTTKILFRWPFRDSQSGMWIFKHEIWRHLDVQSDGMPFSQELKIEAYVKGFKCAEVPIEYRVRTGEVKLSTFSDGIGNMMQLFKKRFFKRKRNIISISIKTET